MTCVSDWLYNSVHNTATSVSLTVQCSAVKCSKLALLYQSASQSVQYSNSFLHIFIANSTVQYTSLALRRVLRTVEYKILLWHIGPYKSTLHYTDTTLTHSHREVYPIVEYSTERWYYSDTSVKLTVSCSILPWHWHIFLNRCTVQYSTVPCTTLTHLHH